MTMVIIGRSLDDNGWLNDSRTAFPRGDGSDPVSRLAVTGKSFGTLLRNGLPERRQKSMF